MMRTQMLEAQINALCTEIGALEFNHKMQMQPRYERLEHLSREMQQGAKQ